MLSQQNHKNTSSLGFTLIELSIVLVIIGLIIGGVLIGQDLVKSSQIRSLASQLQQYKSAVATFENKYNRPLLKPLNHLTY